MTEGGKRRDGILSLLEESDIPLSGTELAHRFKVSRQVIVQAVSYTHLTLPTNSLV